MTEFVDRTAESDEAFAARVHQFNAAFDDAGPAHESYRPAAPSEPPVSDWERERRDAARFRPVAAGPGPCDRSPAEQDDERGRVVEWMAEHLIEDAHEQPDGWLEGKVGQLYDQVLAARPSADTETLRRALLEVTDDLQQMHDSGDVGRALEETLTKLRAALDAR